MTVVAVSGSRSGKGRLLALFHTPYFGRTPAIPADDRVDWTTESRQLGRADIVIVHLPDWRARRRVLRHADQVSVAWSQESRVNYPVMADPRFMAQFDLRMTYETSADIWAPYLPTVEGWTGIAAAPIATLREDSPVAAFISSGVDKSGRVALFRELFRYIRIDSYGLVFNTRHIPVPDEGRASKLRILARYPFCLAFENAISPDYVTEKVFDALAAGSIPVYLGASNVEEFVPAGSYIDASRYAGARELATYLRFLVDNPVEMARYHAWRREPLPAALLQRSASIAREPFARLLDLCFARRGEAPPRRELGRLRQLADGFRARLARPFRAPAP